MSGHNIRGEISIERFSPTRADDVARIFNAATAAHPYCGVLTPESVLDRLCAPSYFDPAALLIAYRGGHPVAYAHGAFGKPRRGSDAPDREIGNVRGLFFPPEDVGSGRAVLDELLRYLEGQGATYLHGWGSFAGYPFYRGLYLGTEPVAAASHAHAIVRLVQAGFRVNQHSIFLTCPLEEQPAGASATPPVTLVEAPLTHATTWDAESWIGLAPRQITAWRGPERVGQLTWDVLADLIAKRGHPVGSIASLSVEESYRRQGIARALTLEAMRRAYRAGAREMTVATTQDNAAALHTYYGCGFAEREILLGHLRAAPAPER